jgi:hypothetical protein
MFKGKFPIIQTNHEQFSSSTMSSLGLEGLADNLICSLNVSFGREFKGKIDISSSVPIRLQKYSPGVYNDFPQSSRIKFEQYLPERIKINWVEENKLK